MVEQFSVTMSSEGDGGLFTLNVMCESVQIHTVGLRVVLNRFPYLQREMAPVEEWT